MHQEMALHIRKIPEFRQSPHAKSEACEKPPNRTVEVGPSCGRRAAIALALVWAFISPASSQESIVYPLIRQSCGAWLEERKGEDQNLQIWVLGFLSGASVYGGVGLGKRNRSHPLSSGGGLGGDAGQG